MYFILMGVKTIQLQLQAMAAVIKEYRLPIVVGRDQFGNRIVYDMVDANTPHLLIAGETGSGKVVWCESSCLH